MANKICDHKWEGHGSQRKCERCGVKAVILRIKPECIKTHEEFAELTWPTAECMVCPMREPCYRITLQGGFAAWNPNMPWSPLMAINASTYTVTKLFDVSDVEVEVDPDPNALERGECVDSPQGTWRYSNPVLPGGLFVETFMYDLSGFVVFDGNVTIPTLNSKNEFGRWNEFPYMSISPSEVLGLREGIDRAKGRVVVAGLGLGYALAEISKKKNVDGIILVEISEELVDWILPEVKKHMEAAKLEQVIVGDAYVEVPKLKATTAIIDIFPSYGGNNLNNFLRMKKASKGIKDMWGWGLGCPL
jgi:hypothetical protein